MKKKNVLFIFILAIIVIGLIVAIVGGSSKSQGLNNDKYNVVVSSFSTYDFVKQIVGNKINVHLLLKPGVESHGYDPTAQDLTLIQNSDVFIYIGEEMETWVDKVLSTLDVSKTNVVRLMSMVQTVEEVEVDGAEHEDGEEEHEIEYDEHIWTSPANSIVIVNGLANVVGELDKENAGIYYTNADKYIEKIKKVQAQIQDIVNNKVRDRLVFGDKMPMQYFLNEFGLTASAAFNGCSTETEPSSATIAYLINKVKEEKIPVVLYIEMSTGQVAKTIANEAGAVAMQIQSLHNISKEDFDNGETYVSLMTRNLAVLKAALQ